MVACVRISEDVVFEKLWLKMIGRRIYNIGIVASLALRLENEIIVPPALRIFEIYFLMHLVGLVRP